MRQARSGFVEKHTMTISSGFTEGFLPVERFISAHAELSSTGVMDRPLTIDNTNIQSYVEIPPRWERHQIKGLIRLLEAAEKAAERLETHLREKYANKMTP